MVGLGWRARSHSWQNTALKTLLGATKGGKKSNPLEVNTEGKMTPVIKACCAMPRDQQSLSCLTNSKQ